MNDPQDEMNTILETARNDPTYLNLWSAFKRIQMLHPSLSNDSKNNIRLAVIGSTTLEPLAACLEVKVRLEGFFVETYIGGFNTYQQDSLNPGSPLYKSNPDVIILCIDAWSILDKMFIATYVRMNDSERQALQEELSESIGSVVDIIESNTSALILVNNLIIPVFTPFGIVDRKMTLGLKQFFEDVNMQLMTRFQKKSRVFIFDLDSVAADFGKSRITNWNTWYRGSIPFSEEFTVFLADEYLRFILAFKGKSKKCIVLDLDNTLWGGVIGEDGLEGIKLGNTSPGLEYMEFQRALLSLYNRGIILGICSKNNYDDAIRVFREHPFHILKEEHFAAMRINWQNKVANLKDLAEEIGIGLDSIVFIDDNPVERAQIMQAYPEVLVVDLPKNPRKYRSMLESLNRFDVLAITKEDLERGQMYAGKRKRAELESTATSIEDFLRTLELKVQIHQVTDFDAPRVVQLINKTNQFNLTTRRYTDAEIQVLRNSSDAIVYSMAVHDKFGDEGVVGVAIVRRRDSEWTIDSFLMSCRVIGRSAETALLAKIVADARKDNAQRIVGDYIPTKKNIPAADFYQNHNFTMALTADGVGTRWILNLNEQTVEVPEWIELIEG